MALPEACGRDYLVEKCIAQLCDARSTEEIIGPARLLETNLSAENRIDLLMSELPKAERRLRHLWLHAGGIMGALPRLPQHRLNSLMPEGGWPISELRLLYQFGHSSMIELDAAIFNQMSDQILDGNWLPHGRREEHAVLGSFAETLNPIRYIRIFSDMRPEPLRGFFRRHVDGGEGGSALRFESHMADHQAVIVTAERELQRTAAAWATELSPWSNVVEVARGRFGHRWALSRMAAVAAGINSRTLTCAEASDPFDESIPLCHRARFMRLRAGVAPWWRRQLELNGRSAESDFVPLVLSLWGSVQTLVKLATEFGKLLESMDSGSWKRIMWMVRHVAGGVGYGRRGAAIDASELTRAAGLRVITVIGRRVPVECQVSIWEQFFSTYDGDDAEMRMFCEDAALEAALSNPRHWSRALEIVAWNHRDGLGCTESVRRSVYQAGDRKKFPVEAANAIAKNARSYPMWLVGVAEECCRIDVASRVKAVLDVAIGERWFPPEYDS